MIIASSEDFAGASDYIMMPIMLGLIGYVASIIGVFSMFVLKNGSDAAAALRNTTFIAAASVLDWRIPFARAVQSPALRIQDLA